MRQILFILLCISLFACSADKKEKATGVIPEQQLKALEDARKVEDLLKKEKEDADKKIQEATE